MLPSDWSKPTERPKRRSTVLLSFQCSFTFLYMPPSESRFYEAPSAHSGTGFQEHHRASAALTISQDENLCDPFPDGTDGNGSTLLLVWVTHCLHSMQTTRWAPGSYMELFVGLLWEINMLNKKYFFFGPWKMFSTGHILCASVLCVVICGGALLQMFQETFTSEWFWKTSAKRLRHQPTTQRSSRALKTPGSF